MKKLLILVAAVIMAALTVAPGVASASSSYHWSGTANHNSFDYWLTTSGPLQGPNITSVSQQVVTYLPYDAWTLQVCDDFQCTGDSPVIDLGPGDGFLEPWVVNWPNQWIPSEMITYEFCRFADRCYDWTVDYNSL